MRNVTVTHSQLKQTPLGRDEILFSFHGRIQRSTFWLAFLSVVCIYLLLIAVLIHS